jgi:hypothetical protein
MRRKPFRCTYSEDWASANLYAAPIFLWHFLLSHISRVRPWFDWQVWGFHPHVWRLKAVQRHNVARRELGWDLVCRLNNGHLQLLPWCRDQAGRAIVEGSLKFAKFKRDENAFRCIRGVTILIASSMDLLYSYSSCILVLEQTRNKMSRCIWSWPPSMTKKRKGKGQSSTLSSY